jgi:membrane protein YdbS with pleckstrin-like domain
VDLDLDVVPAGGTASEAPAPEGDRLLDPRSVALGRVARWPWVLLPILALGPGPVAGYIHGTLPGPALAALLTASTLLTGLMVVYAHLGPLWRYRYTRYRVDTHGIEIRRGNAWRRVITVPRSRIQHTDVAQGPLERRYGLATLTIYTAGTEHSAVPLAGVAHDTALGLRDDLLRGGRSDAI